MDHKPRDFSSQERDPHLNVALRYASRGFKVFPLNGKVPLTPNGHKDATMDTEIIRHWWQMWLDANIGIRPDGFFVVDEDPRNGGDEALATEPTMPKKKIRTYQDYRELGSELYAAKKLLLKASLKTKAMFGKSKPEGRILEKVLKDLGEARVSLDKLYGRDIPDDADVPEGEPICPLYPASFDN